MRTRWGLIALLFTCGLFAAMQFIKVSLVLTDLSAYFQRSLETVSILVSLVSFVGIALGVVGGAVVARIGTRPVILGALILGSGLSLVQSLLPPFSLMVPLRVIEGISHMALVVAVPPTMAALATDRDRPVVMSIWAMFFGVAFSLAAVTFPAILATGGIPSLYVLHGVGLAGLAAILFVLLPKTRPSPQKVTFFQAHAQIYTTPNLCAPGLIFLFYTMLFVATVTFLPDALGQPHLAGILPLVSLAGTLTAGFLCRYVAVQWVMMGGYICLILGAVPLFWGYAAASYVMFIGMGLVPGACFAAIPVWNRTAQDQARATGAIAQLGNVGTGLGTPLFAIVIGLFGGSGLFWTLLILPLAGFSMVLILQGLVRRVP